MPYFLILNGEDGTTVEQCTREEIEERITPDADEDGEDGLVFLSKIPDDDKGCWMVDAENAAILIKGEIIVPRAVQVTTKYEVE